MIDPLASTPTSLKYEWAMILSLFLTPEQESQLHLLTSPSNIGLRPSDKPLGGIQGYRMVFTYPIERSNGSEDRKAFQWFSRIYDEYAYFDITDYIVVYRLRSVRN